VPVNERLESLALIACALALVALAGSAAVGVLRRADGEPAVSATPVSRRTAVEVPATPRGRVQVLNAAGRGGLARRATEQLRRAGYDVVHFGNAPARRDSSVVLDRVGKPGIARGAGERLGISRVRTELDSTLYLDATVLLGADWAVAIARAEAPEESSLGARVRRWLGRR
jgi:hypothetical protein